MTEGVKCTTGMLFKSHAMYAMYTIVTVSRQFGSYTCSVNFTILSQHFAYIQGFSGSWREVVVYMYHRWSPEFRLVFPCYFFWKQSLICRTLQKSNFPLYQFCSVHKHKGGVVSGFKLRPSGVNNQIVSIQWLSFCLR